MLSFASQIVNFFFNTAGYTQKKTGLGDTKPTYF